MLLIRRIRDLLYDQGFTISGARNQLGELGSQRLDPAQAFHDEAMAAGEFNGEAFAESESDTEAMIGSPGSLSLDQVRKELMSIRESLLA